MTEQDIATLRAFRATLDPSLNDNDLAHVLIISCFDLGIRSRQNIRAALALLGCNARHAVIYLDKSCGSAVSSKPWGKAANGEYFEHIRV